MRPSCFLDLRMERCQLEYDVIHSSWNTPSVFKHGVGIKQWTKPYTKGRSMATYGLSVLDLYLVDKLDQTINKHIS